MASNSDSGAGTVFMAFTLGALTGAAFALLMAPAPGDETRRILSERAREGADRASGTARDVGERVRHGREVATEAVEKGLEKGKAMVDRQRETITTAVERGREAYKGARQDQDANEEEQV